MRLADVDVVLTHRQRKLRAVPLVRKLAAKRYSQSEGGGEQYNRQRNVGLA
jgi:hypothetical protein